MAEPPGPLVLRWHVSLHFRDTLPTEGETVIGTGRLDPLGLLAWLESQLGLSAPPVAATQRVVQYVQRLRSAAHPYVARSLAEDEWSTAQELLRRRDELLLAGWTPSGPSPGDVVAVIKKAEETNLPLAPGLPDRIGEVLAALDGGQVLPRHDVTLAEPPKAWPPLWRKLLSRLTCASPPAAASSGPNGSSLRTFQENLLHGGEASFGPDASLRVYESGSLHAAAQVVAAWLASYVGDRRRVVVYGEDEATGVALDAAFHAHGVPTMGVSRQTSAQPALQVLPLALRLCWEPVNPYLLLDFLQLPLSPIRRAVGRRLAQAMDEQPGFDSDAWRVTVAELTAPDADPDGEVKRLLEAWFGHARIPRGHPLPVELVQDRASRVAQWCVARAERLAATGTRAQDVEPLRSAAAQAKAVGELVAAYAPRISGPQLERILQAVIHGDAATTQFPAEAGGPRWTTTLCDLPPDTECVIWFGTGSVPLAPTPWTPTEVATLRANGVEVDDGRSALAARRAHERAAIARTKRLVVFEFPQSEDLPIHPVWLQARTALPKEHQQPLESLLAGQTPMPSDLGLQVGPHEPIAPQPVRTAWEAPVHRDLLPAYLSSTALEKRLACPISWYLQYVAKIRARPAARIQADRRLMGTFAHDVMATVFGDPTRLPTPEEAANRAREEFAARLDRNAAPLALPDQAQARQELLDAVVRSAIGFANLLQAGGYRVVAMEAPFDVAVDGTRVKGRIDAVLEGVAGEAILDLKYGGGPYKRADLAEGRALQLATYLRARAAQSEKELTQAGYLILETGKVLTPTGAPLAGVPATQQVDGPPVGATWDRVVGDLATGEAWLQGKEPIPARPLQPPARWTDASRVVLDDQRADQVGCTYCDHQVLCGLQRSI